MPNPGFHPKEWGYDVSTTQSCYTGFLGVMLLVSVALLNFSLFVAATPFVLLGTHEIVFETPTHWRVRVIRKENDA